MDRPFFFVFIKLTRIQLSQMHLIHSGVMGIVLVGGTVKPTDSFRVELPPSPHRPLERV